MGGRPTEAPGTPMSGRNRDPRAESLVSEAQVAEISAPMWDLPASLSAAPGLPGTGQVMPGRSGAGAVSVMGRPTGRGGRPNPDRGVDRDAAPGPERDEEPDAASGHRHPPTAEPEAAEAAPASTTAGVAHVPEDAFAATPEPASEDTRPLKPTAGVAPAPEPTSPSESTHVATAPPASRPTPADTRRAPEVAHPSAVPARKLSTSRRGPVDPVKTLMHRHRELCERAVDPLEIAAGLEAHGVTDRTAARYRHRDVFSLAEELYARVPTVAGEPGRAPAPAPMRDIETRAAWTLLALLPGAACIATAVALRLTDGVLGGGARLTVTLGGTLVALVGLSLCLRNGPLRAVEEHSSAAAPVYGYWLLGYVLYGDALLHQVLSGGPEGPWSITPAPLLGLALAVAPAAWCAHLFSVHAQRKLAGSRALEEFAAGVRPLLFGTVALFLCVLTGLLRLADLGYGGGGSLVAAAALGVLLLLARLLTVHGFPEPATTGLAAACAVEAAAPALILTGRLPGLHFAARPVDAVIAAGGTGAVPALACGAAALGLLVHATVALSRASAHTLA